ncbi:MAG: hypothetical protein K6F39_09095 [Lachnospiraceae bacterium]|nr:hypothetical protein [Lachnospiraceae bacterium]
MKAWKLVSGILSIIIFFIVMLQSCAAGVVDAINDEGGTSGGAGFIVGFLMLAGGITSIATKGSTGKGGDVALMIMFGAAALIGITCAGIYADLVIWGFWCLINAVLALVSMKRK